MADLGDITIGSGFPIKEKVVIYLTVNGFKDEAWFVKNPVNKSFSGVVTLDDVAVQRDVRVHHRESGLVVSKIRTDINGVFSISGVTTDEYYVIALPFDEDGANALILDRVQGA